MRLDNEITKKMLPSENLTLFAWVKIITAQKWKTFKYARNKHILSRYIWQVALERVIIATACKDFYQDCFIGGFAS